MDINNTMIIAGCVILIIAIGALFKIPIWKIIKIIINSILGGVLIFVINQIGETWGIHIGLNLVTSIFVGFFGIPGAILLLLIKII